MKKFVLISVLGAFLSLPVMSQIVVKTDAGDLKVRFTGRAMFDAGTFLNDDYNDNGFQINDVRFGMISSFDKNWTAKVELAFQNKGAEYRDVYLDYAWGNQSIRVGNQFQPYGALTLGAHFKFIDDASADRALCPSRKLGVAYLYSCDAYNFTAGLFSDGDVNVKNQTNQGVSASTKFIYRPIVGEKEVLHVGVAPMFVQSPNAASFQYRVPTTLGSYATVKSSFADAVNLWKLEGEVIYINGKFYGEAHYLRSEVNLQGSENYSTEGWYAQASYLLKGEKQNYNKKTGLAQNNAAGCLEVLARVSHLNLGDYLTEEYGKVTDYTVGLNYFVNKYVVARCNYVHAEIEDADGIDMIQGRLQFTF